MDDRMKTAHNVLNAMNDLQMNALSDLLAYYGTETFRGIITGIIMARSTQFQLPRQAMSTPVPPVPGPGEVEDEI